MCFGYTIHIFVSVFQLSIIKNLHVKTNLKCGADYPSMETLEFKEYMSESKIDDGNSDNFI